MTRPRPLAPDHAALWRELGARFSKHPVCPECSRFIPPALWDKHMAMHHENRVGLAEEAVSPPPHTIHNEEG